MSKAIVSSDTQPPLTTEPPVVRVGLPKEGYVRLRQLIGPGGPLPVSRSTVYAWASRPDSMFPKPVRIGPGRAVGFRVEAIRDFLANPANQLAE